MQHWKSLFSGAGKAQAKQNKHSVSSFFYFSLVVVLFWFWLLLNFMSFKIYAITSQNIAHRRKKNSYQQTKNVYSRREIILN
jgi:hypothetical protein